MVPCGSAIGAASMAGPSADAGAAFPPSVVAIMLLPRHPIWPCVEGRRLRPNQRRLGGPPDRSMVASATTAPATTAPGVDPGRRVRFSRMTVISAVSSPDPGCRSGTGDLLLEVYAAHLTAHPLVLGAAEGRRLRPIERRLEAAP